MKNARVINGIFWAVVVVAVVAIVATTLPCMPSAAQWLAMACMYIGIPACCWYVVDFSIKEAQQ